MTLKVMTTKHKVLMKNIQNSARYYVIIYRNYAHNRYKRKYKQNLELDNLENTLIISDQWHHHLMKYYRL